VSLPALITLTTDFGLCDPFVGIMKGVMLGINPEAELVDISHQIPSFDVLEGALVLAQSYRHFPAGTIHLAVVDPGVGSARRPILLSTQEAHFVGPDNGLFSFLYDREPSVAVRHLTAEHYFRKPVSHTFHGRDVFAPVAAWLSTGIPPESFGELISDYVRLPAARPEHSSAGLVQGVVLRIDKFGNVMTNLRPEDLPASAGFRLVINNREVARLVTDYAAGSPSEIFAIVGSAGFVEIAANQASAAEVLGARRGAEIYVMPSAEGAHESG
jgi:S-adenosyl-L-methionine hydrolase (adenosine-forming)